VPCAACVVALSWYEVSGIRPNCLCSYIMQASIGALTCSVVLARRPTRIYGFLFAAEAGCGWVPYWVKRMDHHMKEWGHASVKLRLRPREYFKRQCYSRPRARRR
jgi:uncharacterized protein